MLTIEERKRLDELEPQKHLSIADILEIDSVSPADWPEFRCKLGALLRRDWAVRVLDAWAEANPHRCYRTLLAAQPDLPDTVTMVYDHVWVCTPFPTKLGNTEQRFARTAEAARHAAALAVFPTLDRNAPNWPGECP